MSGPRVVRLSVTVEGYAGRAWLKVAADRVLNTSGRLLNLTPRSPEEQKRAIGFGLASELFNAGLKVAQVNSGLNDPCLTIVMQDESLPDDVCHKVAQLVRASFVKADCDVIVDREVPHNLLS